MKLKEDYLLANCCSPSQGQSITGYYSHNNIIKVHRADCGNLAKADPSRLILLEWTEIIADEEYTPEQDYNKLIEIDFLLLKHHRQYGFDYSLKIASMHRIEKQDVFECHMRLKDMGLLKRVEPKMIQYRKNIAKGKWIKHRNHTYYDITDKGRRYLDYYEKQFGTNP